MLIGAAGSRGQALVVFVAAIAVLLGFAALGIDVGYMYTVRHELQRCADAGALAGASAFFDGDWADAQIQAVAESRARDFAHRDPVAGTPLDPGTDMTVGFPSRDRVRVDVSRTVPLFFSRLFLGPMKTLSASAVAEAATVGQNVRNLKPWGIPFPWDDADGDGLYDPGEIVHKDCPEGVTDPRFYFCQGTDVILKIGTPYNNPTSPDGVPSIQQEPGHFFALDFGSGASEYRESIKHDNPQIPPFSIGDAIPLETGNMVGPTVQAVFQDSDSLMNQDAGSVWNAERNLPESSSYHIEDGSWMNSPRIVRIPIYDPEQAMKSGKVDMVIAGFAGFWVESVDHHLGTVRGKFVPLNARGQTAGPSEGPATGPTLKILRLVE